MCYREIVNQVERQHRASGRREFTLSLIPSSALCGVTKNCEGYCCCLPQQSSPSEQKQFHSMGLPWWVWRWCAVRRGFKALLVPIPCPGQGHFPLDTLGDIWTAQELRQTAQLSIAAIKLGNLPCKMMLSQHCFGNMTLNFTKPCGCANMVSSLWWASLLFLGLSVKLLPSKHCLVKCPRLNCPKFNELGLTP